MYKDIDARNSRPRNQRCKGVQEEFLISEVGIRVEKNIPTYA